MMLIDEIQVIKNIVESIDTSLSFKVVDNTLVTCNTSYVSKNYILTIGLEEYTVIDVVKDSLITLDRTVTDILETNTIIQSPKFRHGTINSVSIELTKDLSKPTYENYPLVFLLEELETNYTRFNIPYATSLVKLFFISQTDYQNYTIDEHHKNTINPLKGLVNGFLNSANLSKDIVTQSLNDFSTNLHPIMGFTDSNGYVDNYLEDNLSAIQLTINIPFYKNNKCCKN